MTVLYLSGMQNVCHHKDCYNCPIQKCRQYPDGETRIEIDENTPKTEREELAKIMMRNRVRLVRVIQHKGA